MLLSYKEQLVACGDQQNLTGMLTTPVSPGTGLPTVIILNSGLVRRIGTRRLSVRLARALANAGFNVLRFDFSGLGDSTPRKDAGDFTAIALEDLRVMIDYLGHRLSTQKFVVAGLCSGANVALSAAGSISEICGVVQLNPHIHKNTQYYVYQITRTEWWRKVFQRYLRLVMPVRHESIGHQPQHANWGPAPSRDERERELMSLAQNDVSLFTLFTVGFISYPGQFRDVYPAAELNDDFRCVLRLAGDHVISALPDQTFAIEQILSWCAETFPGVD